MATIFSILINPVTVSVLVLCALCLTGLNVLLSMLIACIIGGVAGGIPLLSAPEGTQTVMQLLTSVSTPMSASRWPPSRRESFFDRISARPVVEMQVANVPSRM